MVHFQKTRLPLESVCMVLVEVTSVTEQTMALLHCNRQPESSSNEKVFLGLCQSDLVEHRELFKEKSYKPLKLNVERTGRLRLGWGLSGEVAGGGRVRGCGRGRPSPDVTYGTSAQRSFVSVTNKQGQPVPFVKTECGRVPVRGACIF